MARAPARYHTKNDCAIWRTYFFACNEKISLCDLACFLSIQNPCQARLSDSGNSIFCGVCADSVDCGDSGDSGDFVVFSVFVVSDDFLVSVDFGVFSVFSDFSDFSDFSISRQQHSPDTTRSSSTRVTTRQCQQGTQHHPAPVTSSRVRGQSAGSAAVGLSRACASTVFCSPRADQQH